MISRLIQQPRYILLILFSLAVALYINTIPNDYALDDSIVITQNIYVQQGISGIGDIFSKETFTGFFKQKKELVQGGRYRPLSLVTFAVEQSIWRNNPHISHLINVMLYGLLCIVLYLFLKKTLKYIGCQSENAVYISFISALIYTVHPLHTEVVANIKGRDEILSLLFSIMALYCLLEYLNTDKLIQILYSSVLLFLGILSKENAVSVPVIAGVIIVLSVQKRPLSKYFVVFLFFGISLVAYYHLRVSALGNLSGKVPGELMNNPYLHAGQLERLATIFYTLLLYLKLLVFPHPLTYDYYPYHIQLQNFSNPLVIFSILIYVGLIALSIICLIKGKHKICVLGILIYLVTILPLSNMVINTGTFMNERFVFFGSIGFCLLIAYAYYFLMNILQEKRSLSYFVSFVLIAVLIVFSARTVTRNLDWKDNYTLFLHDVKISTGSAKGNVTAGGTLYEKAIVEKGAVKKKEYLEESIAYLNRAIAIYPDYIDALLLAGNAYFERDKDFKVAATYYNRIFQKAPGYDLAFDNYKIMLASIKDAETQKKGYLTILSYRANDFDANCKLGSLYGKELGQVDSAIVYLNRAVQIKPKSKDANRDLGVAYGIQGRTDKAAYYFKKTVELDPNDPSNYINLGISYQKLGQIEKAREQFIKAEKLKGQ